jgi:tRNA dimethylallyltransferase
LTPLVIVVGPTGSGKTDLSLSIAERFHCEIVSCDSLQIYRHFNIGTAKPTLDQRRDIPHHLIDIIEPAELFTAGDYSARGRAALREIALRGRIPLVVGGTGFYLRALLEGLFAGPSRDESIRSKLRTREQRQPGSLHRILRRLDREAARRIHENDVNKTMRALEVCLIARKPISSLFLKGSEALEGFLPVKIGLNPPREALYRKLDDRAAKMFEGGLLDEVRGILALGIPGTVKPFESLGYRQALDVVTNRITIDAAIASTQMETRRYAKRQLTWFRRETDVRWFDDFGGEASLQNQVLMFLEELLTQTKLIPSHP